MQSRGKRHRIVEEALKPGSSVARVARAHGVNANQVFHCRWLYRAGQFEVEAPSKSLFPFQVTTAVERSRQQPHLRRGGGGMCFSEPAPDRS